MEKITLYRYNRPDGGVTVSPVKPSGEFSELFRLVADVGMVLTDGVNVTTCTDTTEPEKWQEIADTEAMEADYLEALAELGVTVNEEI
jgi:hypothetical protein